MDIVVLGRLTPTLTLLSGGFQLAVALNVNLDLSACSYSTRNVTPHYRQKYFGPLENQLRVKERNQLQSLESTG